MCHTLRPHELQHARPPCPSPTPGFHLNSHPSSRWCHPAISSSVVPFSSCSQSLPVSESFPMSQLFTSGGQRIGVSASASVLPMNIQGWFPLGLTGLKSIQYDWYHYKRRKLQPWNFEKTIVCCLGHPVCGALLWWPQQINTGTPKWEMQHNHKI